MFTSCRNNGFRMTFETGWTISVRWSRTCYCERRSWDIECSPSDCDTELVYSKDAEIAAWYGDKKGHGSTIDGICETWLEIHEHDQVEGWVSTNDVAGWIAKVAAFKGDHKLESERLRLEERINQWSKQDDQCTTQDDH